VSGQVQQAARSADQLTSAPSRPCTATMTGASPGRRVEVVHRPPTPISFPADLYSPPNLGDGVAPVCAGQPSIPAPHGLDAAVYMSMPPVVEVQGHSRHRARLYHSRGSCPACNIMSHPYPVCAPLLLFALHPSPNLLFLTPFHLSFFHPPLFSLIPFLLPLFLSASYSPAPFSDLPVVTPRPSARPVSVLLSPPTTPALDALVCARSPVPRADQRHAAGGPLAVASFHVGVDLAP